MDILIDASAIKNNVTGAGKYATFLLKAMAEYDLKNNYTVLVNQSLSEEHQVFSIKSNHRISFHFIEIPGIGPKRQYIFWKHIRNKFSYDIFHCLLSNYPLAMKKGIVTIHDLKFLLYPKFLGRYSFVKQFYMHHVFKGAIYSCKKIIAVSHSTKNDLIRYFKLNQQLSKKIQVIHEASCLDSDHRSFSLFSEFELKYNIKKNHYFLFVGEQRPHKNLDGLIKGYQLYCNQIKNDSIPLIVVGAKHSSYSESHLSKPFSGNGNVVFTKHVDDVFLHQLYANSFGFILPSFYEGFGLPILEAMSLGKPVITSNISSMPEVAGDAALYINPCDPQSIADSLATIHYDTRLRRDLSIRAVNRAKMFSWKKVACETISVYEQIHDFI